MISLARLLSAARAGAVRSTNPDGNSPTLIRRKVWSHRSHRSGVEALKSLRYSWRILAISAVFLGCLASAVDSEELPHAIVQKFGKPDVDDTTAFDKHRPPLVTRWLIYRKQGVEFMLVPMAGVNEAPPYKGWKLLGTLDPRTKNPISAGEVLRRMGKPGGK